MGAEKTITGTVSLTSTNQYQFPIRVGQITSACVIKNFSLYVNNIIQTITNVQVWVQKSTQTYDLVFATSNPNGFNSGTFITDSNNQNIFTTNNQIIISSAFLGLMVSVPGLTQDNTTAFLYTISYIEIADPNLASQFQVKEGLLSNTTALLPLITGPTSTGGSMILKSLQVASSAASQSFELYMNSNPITLNVLLGTNTSSSFIPLQAPLYLSQQSDVLNYKATVTGNNTLYYYLSYIQDALG